VQISGTGSNLVLCQIQDFLEIDRRLRIEGSYIVPESISEPKEMPVKARRLLDQLFADDIRRTAEKANINLDDWLELTYEEPMRP
jgi:hypothetical protein